MSTIISLDWLTLLDITKPSLDFAGHCWTLLGRRRAVAGPLQMNLLWVVDFELIIHKEHGATTSAEI